MLKLLIWKPIYLCWFLLSTNRERFHLTEHLNDPQRTAKLLSVISSLLSPVCSQVNPCFNVCTQRTQNTYIWLLCFLSEGVPGRPLCWVPVPPKLKHSSHSASGHQTSKCHLNAKSLNCLRNVNQVILSPTSVE